MEALVTTIPIAGHVALSVQLEGAGPLTRSMAPALRTPALSATATTTLRSAECTMCERATESDDKDSQCVLSVPIGYTHVCSACTWQQPAHHRRASRCRRSRPRADRASRIGVRRDSDPVWVGDCSPGPRVRLRRITSRKRVALRFRRGEHRPRATDPITPSRGCPTPDSAWSVALPPSGRARSLCDH